MLRFLVVLLCGVAGALYVPMPASSNSTDPNYFVIESITQLNSSGDNQPLLPPGPAWPGPATPETEVLLRREEERQTRVKGIMKQVLLMLNLKCVPRRPRDSNIDPETIRILRQMMQNQTDSDSDNLLKRAQSFYPTCDLPEDISYLFRRHRDSMNIYFNLSSFFLPQPENARIDMAELRLYRVPKNKSRRRQRGFDFGSRFNEVEDTVRVSVYASSATMPGNERLVDSFLVPRYSQQEAVTFNVSAAVWSTDDLNLLLRVTVEDVFGGRLRADSFFEQMDCSVVNGSPLPWSLVRDFNQNSVPLKPRNPYPVLDLSTAETAGSPPLDGLVPSMELCPEPQPLPANQPRWPTSFYNDDNGFGDGLPKQTGRPNGRPRRRHQRRPHNRRHSSRRLSRNRRQH